MSIIKCSEASADSIRRNLEQAEEIWQTLTETQNQLWTPNSWLKKYLRILQLEKLINDRCLPQMLGGTWPWSADLRGSMNPCDFWEMLHDRQSWG